MKVNMHIIKFDADEKLTEFIQRRLDKLETFYDRIIDGEVFLKLNNQGIENKTVEVKLNIPGEQLFAEASSRTFEAATDEAYEALRRQLRRYKEKQTAY